jgi:hypothetical protein
MENQKREEGGRRFWEQVRLEMETPLLKLAKNELICTK